MVSISKGFGYLVSAVSVMLLGAVAWRSASERPLLVAGMILSVVGMVIRWIAHNLDERERERIERRLDECLRAQKPIA
jgi:Flp pilus assembly protein TadB